MKLPKGPWPDVPEQRRKIMSAIRGRDTKPELAVRRLLHAMGYRFKVNERRFGYRPDILLTARRKVIFIHGCFWHGHDHGSAKALRTRSEFWQAKLARNKARDRRALEAFGDQGWTSRDARGLGQVELAVIAGVDRSYISDIEHGKYGLSIDKLDSLAEALGIAPWEMLHPLTATNIDKPGTTGA